MQRLLEVREASARRVAELLDIGFEEMTPEILRQFIITHELGHAKDFVRNYETPSEYATHDNPADEWRSHYDGNLSTLPVAGFDPVDLKYELEKFDSLESFFATHSVTDSTSITSKEALLQMQEIAYRESAYESYADDFAATFLKSNAEALGLPSSQQKAA